MKRICTFLLALVLALSFAACKTVPQNVPAAPAQQELTVLPSTTPPQELSSGETHAGNAQAPPDAAQAEAASPQVETSGGTAAEANAPEQTLPEDGSYTTKEDVALYLHLYGHLPDNFITKKQAESLGWSGGSLEPYAPGKCIGGSRFGNYEGLLPDADGRRWTECDIDTLGSKSRGAKRIVFSNDGLIYYTGDHYKSFELLYGED